MDQDTSLKQEVKLLLKWHCSTQLSRYSTLLTRANADFQSNRMTQKKLNDYTSTIEGYWTAILRESGPRVGRILVTIDTHQIEQLFDNFSKKNKKIEKKINTRPNEELSREYQERMTDELERWFGPLTPTQENSIIDWSKTFKSLAEVGLHNRREWQTALRNLLDQRQDTRAFKKEITELLINRHVRHPPAYKERIEHNRRVTIEMLYRVSTLLDDAQRTHLNKELSSLAADFATIACSQKITQR